MSKVLIFFFLIMSQVHAETLFNSTIDIVKLINDINQDDLNKLNKKYPQCSEQEFKKFVENAITCLNDICPQIKDTGYLDATLSQFIQDTGDYPHKNEIEEKIDAIIKSNKSIAKNIDTGLRKTLAKKEIPLTLEEKKILLSRSLVYLAMNDRMPMFTYDIEFNRGKVEFFLSNDDDFSHSKKKELQQFLDKGNNESLVNAASKFVNGKALEEFMLMEVFGWKAYKRSRYPGKTDLQIIKIKLEKLKEIRSKLGKHNESFGIVPKIVVKDFELIIKKLEKNENITEETISDLMEPLAIAQVALQGLENKELDEQLKDKNILEFYQLLNADHDLLPENSDTRVNHDYYKEECINNIKMAAMLPSQKAMNLFAGKIPAIKEKVKKVVKPLYSAPTNKEVDKILTATHFEFPVNAKKLRANFLLALDRFREESAALDKDLKDKINQKKSDKALLYQTSEIFDDLGADYKTTEMQALCDGFGVSPYISDHNLTVSGKIGVSWQSIAFPKAGEGIVAHELGHSVYHLFNDQPKKVSGPSKEKHKTINSCTTKNHEFESNPERFHDEDYSDMIAFNVTKNNEPTFCILIDSTDNDIVKDFLHIDNKSQDDDHSESFYRALFEYNLKKGALPQSCQEYLKVEAPKAGFENCLLSPSNKP